MNPGEQTEDHGNVHIRFTERETHSGEAVRNSQHEIRGDQAADDRDDKGILEHLREVQDVPVRKQFNIVSNGISLREEGGHIGTRFRPKARQQDPDDGHDPYKCEDSQQYMDQQIYSSFSYTCFILCGFHYMNASSFL